jgi:hypothetical protein
MVWGGEENDLRSGLHVPGPKQINGDITKVFNSMLEIMNAGGSVLEKLGNQFRNKRRPKKIGVHWWRAKSVKGSSLKKYNESKLCI